MTTLRKRELKIPLRYTYPLNEFEVVQSISLLKYRTAGVKPVTKGALCESIHKFKLHTLKFLLTFNKKIFLALIVFAKITPAAKNLACQVITIGCHLRKLKSEVSFFLTRTR